MGTAGDGRPGGTSIPTITHARLRAEQGDVETAKRILEAVLDERPYDAEARELLDRLAGARGAEHAEPVDEEPLPPVPASAADLAASFRSALRDDRPTSDALVARRLTSMLGTIRAMRGERGVR